MNRINELRKARKTSQDDLVSLLKVQRSAISKYETGKVPLTDETICILADYFNVTTDYLLGMEANPMNTSRTLNDADYAVLEALGAEDRAFSESELSRASPGDKAMKPRLEYLASAKYIVAVGQSGSGLCKIDSLGILALDDKARQENVRADERKNAFNIEDHEEYFIKVAEKVFEKRIAMGERLNKT